LNFDINPLHFIACLLASLQTNRRFVAGFFTDQCQLQIGALLDAHSLLLNLDGR
jgi:hypothetical protein